MSNHGANGNGEARKVHPFAEAVDWVMLGPEMTIGKGARVGIACSGGPDSVALARAVREFGYRYMENPPVLLHFIHSDSDSDLNATATVGALGITSNTEVYFGNAERDGVRKAKDSPQMAARRNRYSFFKRISRELGLTHILMGHTMDDQAETVLMRMMSGHWLAGLGGIPARRKLADPDGKVGRKVTILRPMLGIRRALAADYVRELRLPVVDDPSNHDPKDRRHQVRHSVLPAMLKINPKAVENICIISSQAVAADRGAQDMMTTFLPKIRRKPASGKDPSIVRYEMRMERDWFADEFEYEEGCLAVRMMLVKLGADPRRVSRERCERVVIAALDEGQRSDESLLKGIHFRITKRDVVIVSTLTPVPKSPLDFLKDFLQS